MHLAVPTLCASPFNEFGLMPFAAAAAVVVVADNWDCFDDDVVSACKTEDVLALKGGGDYDMASMLFYRAK